MTEHEPTAATAQPAPAYPHYSEAHLHAFRMWESKGMTCRDLSEDVLLALCEDKNFHGEVSRERTRRAQARAALLSPAPSTPPASTAHRGWTARLPNLKDDDLSSPETMQQWAQANALCVVPVALWAGFVAANREKRENLEAQIKRLDDLITVYEGRLTALEHANTEKGPSGGVRWAGTFQAGHEYHSGELVTRNGLWVCTAEKTTTQPGSNPTSWRLIVSRRLVPSDAR